MPRNLERLRQRRTDAVIKASGVNEGYAKLSQDDAVKYAVGAMQPIDPVYTKNTFAEADRVQEQLSAGLPPLRLGAEFCYQGSVTSDTHIRVHTDIDLLSIHTSFYTLEPPLRPSSPYAGDPLDDLRSLRSGVVSVLKRAFPAADVDDTRGKAVALSGGSLRRKVDIVVANWWHTSDYEATRRPELRGVQVYDAKARERVKNKPFLHNERIDARDKRFNGALRKTVRLLKSLKYDSDTGVDMSSYDITALAYRMPDNALFIARGKELSLVANVEAHLANVLHNAALRDSLLVPNEMRKIFEPGHARIEGLRQLHAEAAGLLSDIQRGIARSFRNLAEARIEL